MKVFFKTNLFIWFFYFETQQLKSYSWFMFPMFDPNLVQNDILFEYGGSTCSGTLMKKMILLVWNSSYKSAEDPDAIFSPFVSIFQSISESPTFCCRSVIFSDAEEFVELDGDACILHENNITVEKKVNHVLLTKIRVLCIMLHLLWRKSKKQACR